MTPCWPQDVLRPHRTTARHRPCHSGQHRRPHRGRGASLQGGPSGTASSRSSACPTGAASRGDPFLYFHPLTPATSVRSHSARAPATAHVTAPTRPHASSTGIATWPGRQSSTPCLAATSRPPYGSPPPATSPRSCCLAHCASRRQRRPCPRRRRGLHPTPAFASSSLPAAWPTRTSSEQRRRSDASLPERCNSVTLVSLEGWHHERETSPNDGRNGDTLPLRADGVGLAGFQPCGRTTVVRHTRCADSVLRRPRCVPRLAATRADRRAEPFAA